MVAEAGDEVLKAGGKILAGGGRMPEKAVKLESGRIRYPDIIAQAPDGTLLYVNIGRIKKDLKPVPREVLALKDLKASGVGVEFVPYIGRP